MMRCQRQGTRTIRKYSGSNDASRRIAEVAHLHAGDVEHRGGDGHAGHGGAQVGLFDDQQRQQHAGRGSRKQHMLPVGDLLPARFQEVCEVQNDRGLGQLRRLERQRRRT